MIKIITPASRNGEVLDVLDACITGYNQSSVTTDPYLISIFSELQPLSPAMVAAIAFNKAESKLAAADTHRDNKIRGLFLCVQSALLNDDAVVKTAAQRIDAILKKYGLEMIAESYATESSLIKAMMKELEAEELVASVAAVPGCADNIAQLKTSQENFSTIYDAFAAAKSSDKNIDSATALKAVILEKVNHVLVYYMKGMNAVNKATYGSFASLLAQIIDDNNARVNRRLGNNNTEGDETDDDVA